MVVGNRSVLQIVLRSFLFANLKLEFMGQAPGGAYPMAAILQSSRYGWHGDIQNIDYLMSRQSEEALAI